MDLRFRLTPIRLTVLSFLALICLGTVLLMLPISTTVIQSASFIDAFFTATSAVCVTGLIVQDTGSFFSVFGQGVILVLIQLGGLGIMTLYASLPVIFGRQLKISQRRMFSAIFDIENYSHLRETLTNIVKYTLVIELIGTVILSWRFFTLWGDFEKSLYHGLFHAISAFCNAGFMLYPQGFVEFSSDFWINITLIALYSLGGIGFIVIHQVMQRRSFIKLSPNSRLAITVSLILIFAPSFFVFYLEFDKAFLHMGVFEKFLASFFQVTSTRTVGFNTMDISTFSNATLFLFCILMFIGASPGGTGGGVKTTTCGLLFLSIRAIFRGQADLECYGRQVPKDVVTRSIAIIAIAFSIITFFIITLMMVEKADFLPLFFEVISAFSTVGLSLGATPELSALGKFLICVVMFIGRIGTLSLIFILGREDKMSTYKFPVGKFMVG